MKKEKIQRTLQIYSEPYGFIIEAILEHEKKGKLNPKTKKRLERMLK